MGRFQNRRLQSSSAALNSPLTPLGKTCEVLLLGADLRVFRMNTGRTCQRCGGIFQAVLADQVEDSRALAALLIRDRRIEFIKVLHGKTGCELTDAKGTMQHISQDGAVSRMQ